MRPSAGTPASGVTARSQGMSVRRVCSQLLVIDLPTDGLGAARSPRLAHSESYMLEFPHRLVRAAQHLGDAQRPFPLRSTSRRQMVV